MEPSESNNSFQMQTDPVEEYSTFTEDSKSKMSELASEFKKVDSTLHQFDAICDSMNTHLNHIVDLELNSNRAVTKDYVQEMYSPEEFTMIKNAVEEALLNRPIQIPVHSPETVTTSSILTYTCSCMGIQPVITKDEIDTLYKIETIRYIKCFIDRFFIGRIVIPKYLDPELIGHSDARFSVENVMWDSSPEMSFLEIGNKNTFSRYFKPNKKHIKCEEPIEPLFFKGLKIKNSKQPLLLCRKSGNSRDDPVLLIPELCWPSCGCKSNHTQNCGCSCKQCNHVNLGPDETDTDQQLVRELERSDEFL